jgi:hypothetical protein
LSVKHPPGEAIGVSVPGDDAEGAPPLGRRLNDPAAEESQKSCKVSSVVARKDAGDILPRQPAGACTRSQSAKFEGEVATLAAKASTESGDAEVLAGGSADKNVNRSGGLDLREVAIVWDLSFCG